MPTECISTTWECEYCYQEFYSEGDCIEHEKKCYHHPNFNEVTGDAVTPLCAFCEDCTAEGYRPNSCKMEHPDSSEVFHCNQFTLARDATRAA